MAAENPTKKGTKKGEGWEEFEGSEQDVASQGDDYPQIDFNTFVLSLSTSALMHLGEGAEKGEKDGGAVVDLAMARQTIDLLGLLEQKTRGNLSGEEERLLTQVLFDLRMRYVERVKKSPPAGE
jgi:hypothetical protein